MIPVDRGLVAVAVEAVLELLLPARLQHLELGPLLQLFLVVLFVAFIFLLGDGDFTVEVAEHVLLGLVGLVGQDSAATDVLAVALLAPERVRLVDVRVQNVRDLAVLGLLVQFVVEVFVAPEASHVPEACSVLVGHVLELL